MNLRLTRSEAPLKPQEAEVTEQSWGRGSGL